jgi:hypothetical protein
MLACRQDKIFRIEEEIRKIRISGRCNCGTNAGNGTFDAVRSCIMPRFEGYRGREVGGRRVPRQLGQVRKEAAPAGPTWVVSQPLTLAAKRYLLHIFGERCSPEHGASCVSLHKISPGASQNETISLIRYLTAETSCRIFIWLPILTPRSVSCIILGSG